MGTYTRADDGEEMVEVKPGQFVSRRIAERMGLPVMRREPAKAQKAAPLNKAARPQRVKRGAVTA